MDGPEEAAHGHLEDRAERRKMGVVREDEMKRGDTAEYKGRPLCSADGSLKRAETALARLICSNSQHGKDTQGKGGRK